MHARKSRPTLPAPRADACIMVANTECYCLSGVTWNLAVTPPRMKIVAVLLCFLNALHEHHAAQSSLSLLTRGRKLLRCHFRHIELFCPTESDRGSPWVHLNTTTRFPPCPQACRMAQRNIISTTSATIRRKPSWPI